MPPIVDVEPLRVVGSLRTVGSTRVTGGVLLRVGGGVDGARTTSVGADRSGARAAAPGVRVVSGAR